MEDPWGGDAWTANGIGGIGGSAPPKLLDAAAAPWTDDDGWAGWSDAAKESPGWAPSPGLRPLATAASPDPWAAAKGGEQDGEAAVDSAVSLCSQAVWAAEPAGEEEAARPAAEPGQQPAEDGPEAGRRGSRVHKLVEMYDGMARRGVPSAEAPTNGLGSPPAEDGPATETAPDSRQTSPRRTPFAVDLSKLDELFPDTPAAPHPPAPEPDAADDDGFGGASERRAWHRISRFGSARRHDCGSEDDSYVRVGWAGSCVRERTLAIVRRWLEQPPCRGAVPGAGGAFVFNWDEPAAPVAIGDLLRQRRAAAAAGSEAAAAAGSEAARAEADDDEDNWGEMVLPDAGDPLPPATATGDAPAHRGADGPALAASTMAVGMPPPREDDIVASILRSLPDLTYMLR